MNEPNTTPDLAEEVRALLLSRKGEWQVIASKADVSYSWLSKFFNGHIENPGYQTLRSLHAYLVSPPSAQQSTPTESAGA